LALARFLPGSAEWPDPLSKPGLVCFGGDMRSALYLLLNGAQRLPVLLAALLLGGCADRQTAAPLPNPDAARAEIVRLMQAAVPDRQGWATDIYAAFAAQQIEPSNQNLCSVLAVTVQESTFQAAPAVPGLAKIARKEIDQRAASARVPGFVVNAALRINSEN